MVAFYKHHILDWRDGTAALSDRAYRVYHVVVEQIMLNEGPILLHERSLAGLSNRSPRDLRLALDELFAAGKLFRDPDGRISNRRAAIELDRVETNRENAAKGGRVKPDRSANTPRPPGDAPEKSNEINTAVEALLDVAASLKDSTRREEEDGGGRAPEPAREAIGFEQARAMVATVLAAAVPEGHVLRGDALAEAAMIGWLRSGLDLHRDIIPGVIRALADAKYRITRWESLTTWVTNSRDDRLAAEAPQPAFDPDTRNVTPLRTSHEPLSRIAIGARVANRPPPGIA